jgi:hypothetical protein
VLVDVPEDAAAIREETFGPTVTITRVRDAEEAISRANALPYGLGGAVFGKADGIRIARRLRTGMVAVNSTLSFVGMATLPFGGVGDSGFGRIHGDDGLREFGRAKSITVRRAPSLLPAMTFERTPAQVRRIVKARQAAVRPRARERPAASVATWWIIRGRGRRPVRELRLHAGAGRRRADRAGRRRRLRDRRERHRQVHAAALRRQPAAADAGGSGSSAAARVHPEFWRAVVTTVEPPTWYPGLTAREHAELVCRAHGQDPDEAGVDEALERFGLAGHADAIPPSLSSGQKQRLTLALALLRAQLAADPGRARATSRPRRPVRSPGPAQRGSRRPAASILMPSHDDQFAENSGTEITSMESLATNDHP